jgi:hypothetical protein
VQDAIFRFTLDSATEFLFGSCVDSLSSDLPYPHNVNTPESRARVTTAADDFSEAFAKAQYFISERERSGPVWPLFEIFRNSTDEPMKIVNAYIDPIVKDAVDKQSKAPRHGMDNTEELGDDETLLDHLVKITSGES